MGVSRVSDAGSVPSAGGQHERAAPSLTSCDTPGRTVGTPCPAEPAMFDADHLDRLVFFTTLVSTIVAHLPW